MQRRSAWYPKISNIEIRLFTHLLTAIFVESTLTNADDQYDSWYPKIGNSQIRLFTHLLTAIFVQSTLTNAETISMIPPNTGNSYIRLFTHLLAGIFLESIPSASQTNAETLSILRNSLIRLFTHLLTAIFLESTHTKAEGFPVAVWIEMMQFETRLNSNKGKHRWQQYSGRVHVLMQKDFDLLFE